jgi:hypothetical protein
MVRVSVLIYSTVKYHSVYGYVLTLAAKTLRDSIWQTVLLGRYP